MFLKNFFLQLLLFLFEETFASSFQVLNGLRKVLHHSNGISITFPLMSMFTTSKFKL